MAAATAAFSADVTMTPMMDALAASAESFSESLLSGGAEREAGASGHVVIEVDSAEETVPTVATENGEKRGCSSSFQERINSERARAPISIWRTSLG